MLIWVTTLIILMLFAKQTRGRKLWSFQQGARGNHVDDPWPTVHCVYLKWSKKFSVNGLRKRHQTRKTGCDSQMSNSEDLNLCLCFVQSLCTRLVFDEVVPVEHDANDVISEST